MDLDDEELEATRILNGIGKTKDKKENELLNKSDIETAKNWLTLLEVNSEFEASSKEYILSYIEQLEKENKTLKKEIKENQKNKTTEDNELKKIIESKNKIKVLNFKGRI